MVRRALRYLLAASGAALAMGWLAGGVRAQEAAASGAGAAPPPEQLIKDASSESLARLYIYVNKQYPDLAKPTVDLINKKHPRFWGAVTSRLDAAARARSPGLSAEIQQKALEVLERAWPNLHREVMDLVDTRYGLLRVEVNEIIKNAHGEDPRPLIAELLREKYPTLVADVRDEIIVKNPNVLARILTVMAENWPGLFGDVVKQMHKEFPKLAGDVFAMSLAKHPELLRPARRILAGLPAEEQPADEEEADEPEEEAEDDEDEEGDEDEEDEQEEESPDDPDEDEEDEPLTP